jgi:hypothetical protein
MRGRARAALAAACVGVLFCLATQAAAQSGAAYVRFKEQCARLGGTFSGDTIRPLCVPGQRGGAAPHGGGYVPPQQGPTPEQMQAERARLKHNAAVEIWPRGPISEGDWDAIIALLEDAVRLAPRDGGYAAVLARARTNRQVAADYRERMRRHVLFREAFDAGQRAYTDKRWADAVQAFQRALDIRPDEPATIRNLALAQKYLQEQIGQARMAAAFPGAARDTVARLQKALDVPWEVDAARRDALAILTGTESLMEFWRWTPEARAHVAASLRMLGDEAIGPVRGVALKSTWDAIYRGADDRQLAALADAGAGVSFRRAGLQRGQDCAVYALANASGQPYARIAALAEELIGQATWRSTFEQGDPAKVFSVGGGLMGGEVIVLAEALGRADVIAAKDFPAAIRAGHPVVVSIAASPLGLDPQARHQVALTRTFTRGGETWFEMVDSTVDGRLFVSAAQLAAINTENGIAVRTARDAPARLQR